MVGIKTQTRRATKWQENVVNFNAILESGFEFGIVTSKGWGDFDIRGEPLVTITIEEPGRRQLSYEIPLSEFTSKLQGVLES